MTIRLHAMLIFAVAMGISCANEPAEPATPTPAVEQRYEANGTVLDDGDGPELCLGGIAESLPPQCGGMEIRDWSWDVVEGEQTAGGVTWGEFHVIGTYDGSSFRVEQAGPIRPVPEEDGDPFATPCPEPAGGWTSSGPATTEDDRIAAMHTAEDIPEYAGIWIDYLEEPVEFDPGPVILNVAFTGEPERFENSLRAVWDGPLCLISFERTYRELRHAQNELSEGAAQDAGLEILWSSVDVMTNTVELGVVVSTATAEQALIDTYGPGTIRVVPALRPI